ncbi:MAG TPA: hypothetical protein DIC59_04590 [Candidatus Competibacteraceae bacterium]|nr:hypothetical protein [Candidatus Competibacteraceae bacterium]
MAATALCVEPADPFVALRVLNTMRDAGFIVRVDGDALQVAPVDRLSPQQKAFIARHKPALVALLVDADILYAALGIAGATGLRWRQGTPDDWTDDRLLAAGEVLYGDARMVSELGIRYRKPGYPTPRKPAPDEDEIS